MGMSIEQLEDLKAYCNQLEYSLNKANTALREVQKLIESLEAEDGNEKINL